MSCNGPCNQGRMPCPTRQACEDQDVEPPPLTKAEAVLLVAIYGAGAGIVGYLIASIVGAMT